MQLELTSDETELLANVLDSALRELRGEVYRAEVADFKATLKQREHLIASLLERLRSRPVPS
jgi:hypothetical protein